MQREEFERRKRRLEEQLEEGIELLKAGFRQQLRALELVWMTTTEEDGSPPRTAKERGAAPPAVPAAPRAAPSKRPRVKRGQFWEDLDAALDRVPQVFDRNDLVRALGYEPERTALHRAMAALVRQGAVVIRRRGYGRVPAEYEVVDREE